MVLRSRSIQSAAGLRCQIAGTVLIIDRSRRTMTMLRVNGRRGTATPHSNIDLLIILIVTHLDFDPTLKSAREVVRLANGESA
jgi:hypothetical protein